MIGGRVIGSGYIGGSYARDEEAYQLWQRQGGALGHVVHIGYHGDSAVYPNFVKRLWKLRDFSDNSDATFATFRDRIKSIPTFSRAISDTLSGPVTESYGELVLDNADGALDGILALSIDGQPVRVFQGDPTWAYASERFRLLFEAVAESIAATTQDTITIRLRGIEHGANLPIQTTLLPNNTAAGATSSQPWPKSYGNVFNITPALIDETNQVYTWADTAVTSVDRVRDSGYPFQTNPIAISGVSGNTITTATAHGFVQNTRVRCDVGSMPSFSIWTGVAWNGVMFCAVARSSTRAATSPDGITWTSRTLPVSANWNSIAWNGTVFCAVADDPGTVAATSPDGITWTLRALPSSALWSEITWNGTVLCVVGFNSNKAATSPDGITWTARTLPSSSPWYAMAWNGTVFCVIANTSTAAATSPDGITWTARTLPSAVGWQSITWNGTVFCAIADSTTTAATSPDGGTWTSRTMPSAAVWCAIQWSGTTFVVTSVGTEAATSADGITWTARTLPVSTGWYGLAWNGYYFCAIGAIGNYVTISADGITWSGVSNSLPSPLAVSTDYYVSYLSATTFQLAATRGGAAINLTTTTTGAVLVGYHWQADLTNFRLYLDSRPTDPSNLTMDGVAGSTSAATILPTVLNAINVDSRMQTRFALTCAQPVGLYVGERRNRLDVANDLMSGLGSFYGYNRFNLLRMGRIESSYTAHDWTLNEDDFEDGQFVIEKMALPEKQHRLGYRHNNTNQQGKLASGVSSGDANLFSNDYLITAPTLGADEGTNSEYHLLAVIPDFIPSAMTYGSDALTEALRRDALSYGYVATVRGTLRNGRIASEMEFGQVAMVTHSRFGFGSGVRVPITYVEDQPSDDKAVLKFRALLSAYTPGAL